MARPAQQELSESLIYEQAAAGSISGKLPGKIIIDMPTRVGDEFLRALETRLVEATTASWEASFGLLEAYKETNGHCNVPGHGSSLRNMGRHSARRIQREAAAANT